MVFTMRKVITHFQMKIHDDEAAWWAEVVHEAKRRGWPVTRLVRSVMETYAEAYKRQRLEDEQKVSAGPKPVPSLAHIKM